MKKQFISLMMVLAMVILAGTSAMAQNNSSSNPQIMIVGSSHEFSVTPDAGITSTVAWSVYDMSETAAADGSGGGSTDLTTPATGTGSTFNVTWSDAAVGNYYIQSVETRDAGAVGADCAVTTRRYYVTVYDFDMEVFISDASGTRITGAENLAECGEATDANYGDMPDGTGGQAFSNAFDASGVNGDLSAYVGTAPRTERYISFTLTWNTNVSAPPVVAAITADIAVATTAGSDFISIDGIASGDLPADNHIVVTGQSTGGDVTFTIPAPLVFNARWGVDFTTSVTADDIHLYAASDASGTALGKEPVSKEDAQGGDDDPNTTEEQIILGAPATSTISVIQN